MFNAISNAFQRKPLQVTKTSHTAYPEIIPSTSPQGIVSCTLRIYGRANSRLLHDVVVTGKTLKSAKAAAQKNLRQLMAQYEVK